MGVSEKKRRNTERKNICRNVKVVLCMKLDFLRVGFGSDSA